MYCSHCGKRVTDTMLFCPFCGDPIVIPDQDEPEAAESAEPSGQLPEAENTREAQSQEPEEAAGDFERSDSAPEAPQAPGPAPRTGDPETDDAAAELLDWSRSRREYADDVWAERDDAGERFEPLNLDEEPEPDRDWREEIGRRKEAASREKHPPTMNGSGPEPVRLDGVAPKLDSGAKREKKPESGRERPPRKPANTLVPPKPMNPDDIFMDGGRDAYDDLDDYDRYDDPGFEDDGYVYEDEDDGGFFMRHLRGIVGLAMFVILLLMFVIYAFSNAGQLTLAKLNLAWSSAAYSQLGYESYQEGRFVQAGQYYERALQRDADNYTFASSAAMAYFEAEDTEKAAAMLKRCAQIDPSKLEPYIYLLNLYPDDAQRPWDVTQLLQQGYQQTGDIRLKVGG